MPGPYSGTRLPTAQGAKTRCARAEDASHAERAQRPHVGAVWKGVRRILVPGAVPRQECDAATVDVADSDVATGGSIWSLERDSSGIGGEERVEAAAPDHGDIGSVLRCHGLHCSALFYAEHRHNRFDVR